MLEFAVILVLLAACAALKDVGFLAIQSLVIYEELLSFLDALSVKDLQIKAQLLPFVPLK